MFIESSIAAATASVHRSDLLAQADRFRLARAVRAARRAGTRVTAVAVPPAEPPAEPQPGPSRELARNRRYPVPR